METREFDFSSEFSQLITSSKKKGLDYIKRQSLLVCESCASSSHVPVLKYSMQILYSLPQRQRLKVRYRSITE